MFNTSIALFTFAAGFHRTRLKDHSAFAMRAAYPRRLTYTTACLRAHA